MRNASRKLIMAFVVKIMQGLTQESQRSTLWAYAWLSRLCYCSNNIESGNLTCLTFTDFPTEGVLRLLTLSWSSHFLHCCRPLGETLDFHHSPETTIPLRNTNSFVRLASIGKCSQSNPPSDIGCDERRERAYS